MTKLKIRLASWKDRQVIQPLRRMLKRPVDGGLWELLNWPMYHAHTAVIDDQTIGFSAVALHLNGVADDVGTVVHPDFRKMGVASQLRATQVRDLLIMGFTHLYCAAPMSSPEAIQWCNETFGSPLSVIESAYLDPHLYFGATLYTVQENLRASMTPEPFPLSELNTDRLKNKIQQAIKDAAQVQAIGDFNIRKALIRQEQ